MSYEISTDGLILWENVSSGCICHPLHRYIHIFSDEHNILASKYEHLRYHSHWKIEYDAETKTWINMDDYNCRYSIAEEILKGFLVKSHVMPPCDDFFDIQYSPIGLFIKLNKNFASDFPRDEIFSFSPLTTENEEKWRLLWKITSRGTPAELTTIASEKYNKIVEDYEELRKWIARITDLDISEIKLLYVKI